MHSAAIWPQIYFIKQHFCLSIDDAAAAVAIWAQGSIPTFVASIAKFRGHARRQVLRAELTQVLATLPSAEASALLASEVAPKDFEGAFQDHEEVLAVVGPCAAAV